MNLYKLTHLLTALLPILLFFLPCRATQMTYECKDDSSDTFFDNTGCLGEQKTENKEKPFLVAAKEGDLETLEKLKKKGYDVNITDKNGNTALHLAITHGASLELLLWLVHVANVEINAPKSESPFLLAAKKGNVRALCMLYSKVDVHVTDQNGNNALHLAAMHAPEGKGIAWLIDITKLCIEAKNNSKRTAFLCAVASGNLPALKILRKKNANLHAMDQYGNNALHYAVAADREGKTIKWLIDTAKIAIESQAEHQRTPFLVAATVSNLVALKILQTKKAEVDAIDKNGNSALHLAALSDREGQVVKWLIDEVQLAIEAKNIHLKTPFFCAAQKGILTALKTLKEKGANVKAIDKDGYNALHDAASFSPNSKAIEWLIDTVKLPIEAKNNQKKTAFLCAAEKGNLPGLKVLKKKGANLKATSQYGLTALHYAACFASEGQGIKWLLDSANFSIEHQADDKLTPFHYAAGKGNLSTLKMLQKKGAKVDATAKDGSNALHLAASFAPNVQVVVWLIDTAQIDIEAKNNQQETAFICAAKGNNLTALKILQISDANLYATDKNGDNALGVAKKSSGDQATIDWLEDLYRSKRRERSWCVWLLSFFRK